VSPRQSQSDPAPDAARSVRVIDTAWVELDDGERLAVRVWLPVTADRTPVSAIVDSVPYRRSDGTAIGDAAWGTYFAAHGFAFVRPDLRGSGDGTGLMVDEYTETEQRDCEQLMAWLARQPWCTGAVGMIGVSWGAFAGLQMAARAPEELRGVVAIHGSDDRYADDVHYIGGCVSAIDMAHWATCMLVYLNQPPQPDVVGDGWREAWLERLQGARAWIEPWLTHQRRDEYWRQGSARERYDAIGCPVLAVGGWGDGYRDMVLRLIEHHPGRVRGLIGPWAHTSPEAGAPGPAIGFLQECVRFFAACLDDVDNAFFEGPALISYVQESVAPAGTYARRDGRWVADEGWPSPNIDTWTQPLGGDGSLGTGDEAAVSVCSPQTLGIDGGVWCGVGAPGEFASDQRADDAGSLCWDGPPLAERVELLGQARAVLTLSVDRAQAMVAVRVCDVAPDGASTLVARGLLNLSRREGHDQTVAMPVGEPVTVAVPMQSAGYAIPAGHRIRLAVSSSYWPWAWPAPEPVTLTVHCGEDSRLELPRRTAGALDAGLEPFGEPETGTPLATETTMLRGKGGRSVRHDLATGETEVELDYQGWRTKLADTDLEMGEDNRVTYRIVEGNPLSATVVSRAVTTLDRPGFHVRTEAATTMTCDAEAFLVTTVLDAFEGDVRICARTFTHRFPRDGA
jgi:hypothetical protein